MQSEDLKDGMIIIGKSIEVLSSFGKNQKFAEDLQNKMLAKKDTTRSSDIWIISRIDGLDFTFNNSKTWVTYTNNFIEICELVPKEIEKLIVKNRFQLINGT